MDEYYRQQKTCVEIIEPCRTQRSPENLNHILDFERMKSYLLTLYGEKISRWLQALDNYDRGIMAHTLRVTAVSLDLGRSLKLKREQLAFLQFGTLLHDIGKLGIPDAIIQKPGKLTADEYHIVQKHPLYAYEWLSNRSDYQPAKVIPLYHHERWDGKGYPHQLRGSEIPILARVVAVVDVWDALTSDRPYRGAMSNEKAIQLIESEAGSQFDPQVVKAFVAMGVSKARIEPYLDALV